MKTVSVLLITFTLVVAAATSGLCANLSVWALSPYQTRVSSVKPLLAQSSAAVEPAQLFAEAGSTQGVAARNRRPATDPLVSSDPLKPSTSVGDPTSDNRKTGADPTDYPGSNGKAEGCENGKAVGNKHCVASSSK